MMKNNVFNKQLITVIFAGLFSLGNSIGQTAKQANEAYQREHFNDDKFLRGFDENAVIAELKQKGIRESEYKGIIRGRKNEYIAKQKGIVKKHTFSKHDNSKLLTPSGCPNAGFEDTTFTNWSAGTGSCINYPAATPWTAGFVSGPINTPESNGNSQQTLLTDPLGYDLNAGLTGGVPNIPYLAPGGGGVSVRLGNSDINYGTEFLRYPITVTPTNTSFTYQYAVVLENPASHTNLEQPRFEITVYDAAGNAISGPCGVYSVEGLAAAGDPTFFPYGGTPGAPDGFFKRWTTVSIDLSPYVGTTVSIEFVTQDCTLGGHYGYAYIDATCSQLQTTVAFCPSDTILLLTAPQGFTGYQWYDSTSTAIPGATSDSLWISHPILGTHYTVDMLSAAGCGSSLTATLAYSNMTLYQNSHNVTCNGLTNGWAYINQSGAIGPFTYTWVNSSGTTIPNGIHPDSLVNAPAGTYYVTVQSQGGCFSTDTVQLFQPPPVDTTNVGVPICLNPPTGTFSYSLTAPAGSTEYQWYGPNNQAISGATNQTQSINSPTLTDVYTVSYVPTGGCKTWVADTFYLYHLNQPTSTATPVSCYGYSNGAASVGNPSSTPTGVSGPFTYSWVDSASASTIGGNANAITNVFAGTYYVTVTSPGGCKTLDTINVSQPPNTFDSLAITTAFCPGDASIVLYAPPGYSSYSWYANATATGPIVSSSDSLIVNMPVAGMNFTVVIPNPTGGACNIVLSSALEYSAPPPPPDFVTKTNVFTPNGDGKNDVFLLNPNGYKYISQFHLEVFNRWGKKVYTTDDYYSQWDGKINGNTAEEGVYYWMASYTQSCLVNAPTNTAQGFVQIIR